MEESFATMIDASSIELKHISLIEGLRRWSMTVDTIYLRITTDAATETVCEDEARYKPLLKWMLLHLPGFDVEWERFWKTVAEQRDLDIVLWRRQ